MVVQHPIGSSQAEARTPPIPADLFLCFAAAARNLSFTSAARQLGIDQSSVSHKIRELERRLSCVLFVRSTRIIELTKAGRALLGSAERLTQALDDARRSACEINDHLPQSLEIGALPYSFWSPHRVDLVDRFIAAHPQTDVHVHNGPSALLLQWLRGGQIDLAFVGLPLDVTGLDILRLSVERFCLLAPRGHPLEAKASIAFEDVAGHRIAMYSEHHTPRGRAPPFGPFLAAGAIPFEVGEFQRDALVRAAARNHLLVVCNVTEAPMHVGEDFVMRPLKDDMKAYRTLVRRAGFTTPSIEAFWALAKPAAKAEPTCVGT